jgi:hypothetical protein
MGKVNVFICFFLKNFYTSIFSVPISRKKFAKLLYVQGVFRIKSAELNNFNVARGTVERFRKTNVLETIILYLNDSEGEWL